MFERLPISMELETGFFGRSVCCGRKEFKRLWFISFGDSRFRYQLHRIRRQALKFGFISEHIRIFTENELDSTFRCKMRDQLVLGSRGFGYWCWKPQIVLQTLSEMNDGDILLYTDVGCYLNHKGRQRFMDYVDLADSQGICGFQSRRENKDYAGTPLHLLIEKFWSKGDSFDYFNVRNDTFITETAQHGAGIFLVKKTSSSVDFFSRFKQVFLDRFDLVMDTPSVSPNFPGFVRNSHDQSIFSILYKMARYKSFTCAEYIAPYTKYDSSNAGHVILGENFFRHPERRPIYAMRELARGWRILIPPLAKPYLWNAIHSIQRLARL